MSSPDAAAIDPLTPALRPPGRAAGYQCWRHLLFIHWQVPAEDVQRLLPPALTVDTFRGAAWVGLVPFSMSGVRPRGFPAIPGISSFYETNVRTYVHREGKEPGVWFFSLDASSSLAVRVARARWSLPHHRAEMSLDRSGDSIRYRGRRRWPGSSEAEYSITAQIDSSAVRTDGLDPTGHARPGTLEHFLVERYALYAARRDGTLVRGQVHHVPYPLKPARTDELQQNLIAEAGLAVSGPPQHVIFSEGLDVQVFPLQRVGDGSRQRESIRRSIIGES